MGILTGWDYYFRKHAEVNQQAVAQRSTFAMFQEYPQNTVQGRGTMVTQNGINAGKRFSVIQPPQSETVHTVITQNLLAGGTLAGGLYGAPLVPNPDSSGLS